MRRTLRKGRVGSRVPGFEGSRAPGFEGSRIDEAVRQWRNHGDLEAGSVPAHGYVRARIAARVRPAATALDPTRAVRHRDDPCSGRPLPFGSVVVGGAHLIYRPRNEMRTPPFMSLGVPTSVGSVPTKYS